MSLVYLASTLERYGHTVTIYDTSLGPIVKTGNVFRYGVTEEDVYNFLKNQTFDIVGITCSFISRWRFVAKISQQVKEISSSSLVVIGGLFPTYSWEYCLNNCKAVDIIMLGEAELTFAEIVNNISKGYSISDFCKNVDGVVWRKDKILCNPKSKYNDNLDDLLFPAWHLVDLKKIFLLQKKIYELPAPSLPILSSRSCPYRCNFCNMYITHGPTWRARSSENVLNEIEYLLKRFNVHNFYFIDDNFSVNPKRAKDICRGIIERKLNIKYNFHNGLSIKTIDEELVQLMKKSGCTSVCLGVESGSERIRNGVYGKNLSTEKVIEVFNLFHKVKIPTIGFFMIGAPGETKADFEKTKELLIKLPMSLATVGNYTPYPGTKLYDECKEKGWLIESSPDDPERVEMFSGMLRTPDFGPEDVSNWKKELYLTFIRYHWFTLLKEALRPWGVVNLDMFGKFIGAIKFHRTKH